eukprot:2000433-Rhodomonas_salina.1
MSELLWGARVDGKDVRRRGQEGNHGRRKSGSRNRLLAGPKHFARELADPDALFCCRELAGHFRPADQRQRVRSAERECKLSMRVSLTEAERESTARSSRRSPTDSRC